MAELQLKGYITIDSDGIVSLISRWPKKVQYQSDRYGNSIIESIESFAKDNGCYYEHEDGLGGYISTIDDCNLRIYFTNKKCSLEDAMQALDGRLYEGDIRTKVDCEGYSEYTITGLSLDDFSIGGHDLTQELLSYKGKYMHLLLNC